MTKFKALGTFTAILLSVGVAYGGRQFRAEVVVEVRADLNEIRANGNVADAFNSDDSTQLIGCGGSQTTGFCQASNASANPDTGEGSALCFTTDPALIAQIRSMASDSFVAFAADLTTGECTRISVSHNSFYRPKNPLRNQGQ